jgi:pSer/pThr/pTyr-binding forkhead associated (FHA) protein
MKAGNGTCMVRFQVSSKDMPASSREKKIANGMSLVVGRSEGCEICVNDKKLSRVHFSITNRAGELVVEDKGSTNGTIVNGKRLTAPLVVHVNDTIMAGYTKVKIVSIK